MLRQACEAGQVSPLTRDPSLRRVAAIRAAKGGLLSDITAGDCLELAGTVRSPLYRAFDAGLRPGPFPDRAASLLPGLLAATRTGLPPAGDDDLTNSKKHHGSRHGVASCSTGRTNHRG